jgi:hypothetical protein
VKRMTKPLPSELQVARWGRAKLLDELCRAVNHGHGYLFGEVRYHLAREPLKALPYLEALGTEFERLMLIASELNMRLPAKGSGPRGKP